MRSYVEKSTHRSLSAMGREDEYREYANTIYFETIQHLRRHGPYHTKPVDLVKLKTNNVLTNEANRWKRNESRELTSLRKDDPRLCVDHVCSVCGAYIFSTTKGWRHYSHGSCNDRDIIAASVTARPSTSHVDWSAESDALREQSDARTTIQWISRKLHPKSRDFIESWLLCDGNRAEIARRSDQSYRDVARIESDVFSQIRDVCTQQ